MNSSRSPDQPIYALTAYPAVRNGYAAHRAAVSETAVTRRNVHPSGQALADDLWLTAHDSTGFKVRLPGRTLGIALAAGLLAELLLAGRVFLDAGGRLRLQRREPFGDPVLDRIVQEMSVEAYRRARRPLQEQGLPGQDLGEWITFLAVDDLAYGLVAGRLATAGAVVGEGRRTLLGRQVRRWVPVDSTVSGRPANRVAVSLDRRQNLDPSDLIIAALYLVTGLDGHAFAIVDQYGRAELARQIGACLPAMVREVLRTADVLIGESTMIGHR